MGLFGKIKDFFTTEKRSKQVNGSKEAYFQLGSGLGLSTMFTADGANILRSEAALSCLLTNSMYCSKGEFSAIKLSPKGVQRHNNKKLDKLLQLQPNPCMVAATFWERVAWFYFLYNNAFIYVERDPYGNIMYLWSIDPSTVKYKKISTGEIILTFTLDERRVDIPYGMIIHIARNVVKNTLFGENTNSSIMKVLQLIDLNYQGIENAIKTSAYIRFIGECTTKTPTKTRKELAEEFTEQYFQVDRNHPLAIAITDSVMKLTPIDGSKSKQEYANYATVNQWNQVVYKYFGCPEEVIKGTATEDIMTSYYERTIDTFFMRATQAMMVTLFSDNQYDSGCRIVVSDRKLQYLPMKTRLEIFNAVREMGMVTFGTLGNVVGLPVPDEIRNNIAYSQNYTNRETTGSTSSTQTEKDDKEGKEKEAENE